MPFWVYICYLGPQETHKVWAHRKIFHIEVCRYWIIHKHVLSFHSHDRLLRADTFSTKTIIMNDVPTSELRCLCDRWCCVLLINMVTALGNHTTDIVGSLVVAHVGSCPFHAKHTSCPWKKRILLSSFFPILDNTNNSTQSNAYKHQKLPDTGRSWVFESCFMWVYTEDLHHKADSQRKFGWPLSFCLRCSRWWTVASEACPGVLVRLFHLLIPSSHEMKAWIASPGWLFTMVIVSLSSHFFRFVLSDFLCCLQFGSKNPIWRDEEIAVGNFGLKLK